MVSRPFWRRDWDIAPYHRKAAKYAEHAEAKGIAGTELMAAKRRKNRKKDRKTARVRFGSAEKARKSAFARLCSVAVGGKFMTARCGDRALP